LKFSFYLKLELITQQAMKAGFTGGVVVDFPNSTKAKKYKNFLLN
jgi:18S rRNA (guanine1575-N7)-methyltransferase